MVDEKLIGGLRDRANAAFYLVMALLGDISANEPERLARMQATLEGVLSRVDNEADGVEVRRAIDILIRMADRSGFIPTNDR